MPFVGTNGKQPKSASSRFSYPKQTRRKQGKRRAVQSAAEGRYAAYANVWLAGRLHFVGRIRFDQLENESLASLPE